jgi:hypothetical protein
MLRLSFLLLSILLAASLTAKDKKPKTRKQNCARHEHFSEPVIIDNPNAFLDLVPTAEDAELQPVTADGRQWKVSCKDPLRYLRIYWTEGDVDGALPQPKKLKRGASVQIDFEDRKQSKKSGTLTLTWALSRGDLQLASADADSDNHLQWRKPSGQVKPGRSGLRALGSQDYRITAVRFWVDGEQAPTPWSAEGKGYATVKVALCTKLTLDEKGGKACLLRP